METVIDSPVHLMLMGKIGDRNYEKALACLKHLKQHFPQIISYDTKCEFETQWDESL